MEFSEGISVEQGESNSGTRSKKIFLVSATIIVIFLTLGFLFFSQKYSVATFENKNDSNEEIFKISVTLEKGDSRFKVASKVAQALGWDADSEDHFILSLRSIQWDSFKKELVKFFADEFDWNEEQKNFFLTSSEEILHFDNDFLLYAYVPGNYFFGKDISPVFAAELIANRPLEEYKDLKIFFKSSIKSESREAVNDFVKKETEFLPDLIPLPPQDIAIRYENGKTLLVFTTSYYNQGPGKLELVADQETSSVAGDIERKVFQHIYQNDGTFRKKVAGEFLWHEEHLHYHFNDFIEYVLKELNENEPNFVQLKGIKATFCVRDITWVNIDVVKAREAEFRVCGKERQGVSVGWADTYFHTYGSQNFDITDLPSGLYELSFNVNPENLFEEVTTENNFSSAVIEINKESDKVEILSTIPAMYPKFEHRRREQSL